MNTIKTDIPNLDVILSGKGLPLGKLYEIFGEESTSKSTLAQFFAKKFQEQFEGDVIYIDTEQTFDLMRYTYMGGNPDKVEIYQSINVEEILEYINQKLEESKVNNRPVFIIVDTIASTMTKAEIEKGGYAGGISERPRVLSKAFPKIIKQLEETNSTMIIVNQVYDNIGSVGKKSKGGRAIKYYASIRMEVKRVKDIAKKVNGMEIVEGIGVKLTTKKNKLFYPRLDTYLYIHNELGVQEIESIIEYLKQNKLVSQSGAWARFQYEDIDFKFNNAESFKLQADKYPNLMSIIEYMILEKYMHISPLVKTKLIKRFNELEEQLGKSITELTEREKYLASIEERQLAQQEA